MCGIAGIYDTSGAPVEAATVTAMCDVLTHRGPDGEGVYAEGHVCLGHRRLAIIDLTDAASQPMANEDGSMVVVYNGEVYDFQKLRSELQAKGHVFVSRTDTEVIVHGYEEWGADVVSRLNGMFAFAVWDRRADALFVARDRYGIKPLYYTFDHGRFVFASEIKGIIAADAWDRRVDHDALVQYFTFQNIFDDRTLFAGVRLLPPGHCGFVRRGQTRLETTPFWDLRFPEERRDVSFEEAGEDLRRVLEQAVSRHLVSDVPLGSYLSGGMDSGSLVALASSRIPHMMTFTGGFDLTLAGGIEQNFDEREAAEQMARLFQTDHYETVLHGGSMQRVLPRLIWHLEDLRVGMSYQNYYISHLASKFVRVVLSGCGGDEMFAGYPWRYLPLLSTETAEGFLEQAYAGWQRLVPDTERAAFFTPDALRAAGAEPFDVFRGVFGPLGSPDRWSPLEALDREMYFEAKTFLHGLLVVEDKICSAHALETRVPFLDNELVDLILSLPPQYKLDIPALVGSASADLGAASVTTSDGKLILRSAMKGLVPDAILAKQKQGFSTPDASWYRAESTEYVKDILLSPASASRGYFSPAYVERILEEHLSGIRNHRLLIWSLLSFEWWNRVFIDGDGEAMETEAPTRRSRPER